MQIRPQGMLPWQAEKEWRLGLIDEEK